MKISIFILDMMILQTFQQVQAKMWVAISILFLCSACYNNYYYTPGVHHNLRLSQQKQIKGEGGLYRSGGTAGVAAQAAYSPFKHIGLHANYLNAKFSPTERLKKQEGGLAVGAYYLQKNSRKQPKDSYLFEPGFLFDVYAGVAIGQNKNRLSDFFTTNDTRATFNYHKYYLQAGIHYQSFGAVAIGYTFRFFYLDYKKVSAFGGFSETFFNRIDILTANDPFFLRENSIKLSIGSDKINYYLNTNFLTKGSVFNQLFYKSSFQTGLEININDLFKKNKKTIEMQ